VTDIDDLATTDDTVESSVVASDRVSTALLVQEGDIAADYLERLLDIIDVDRWSRRVGERRLPVTCADRYEPHARATQKHGHVCAILSPSREIKIFAEGVEMFAFRGAEWHLLDLQAKYRVWSDAVGNEIVALRLFQTALDLADARQGALFVVLKDPETSLPLLVSPADQLDAPHGTPGESPTRGQMMYMLRGRTATGLDRAVLMGLARTDGATVMDAAGRLLAIGAILLHPEPPAPHSALAVEGARTTAAMAAGRFGAVLKVSEDGLISFYDNTKVWDI